MPGAPSLYATIDLPQGSSLRPGEDLARPDATSGMGDLPAPGAMPAAAGGSNILAPSESPEELPERWCRLILPGVAELNLPQDWTRSTCCCYLPIVC
jgi:hypothetical protein